MSSRDRRGFALGCAFTSVVALVTLGGFDQATVATLLVVIAVVGLTYAAIEPAVVQLLLRKFSWSPEIRSITDGLDPSVLFVLRARWETEREAPEKLAGDPTYILGKFSPPNQTYAHYGPLSADEARSAYEQAHRMGLISLVRFESDSGDAEYEWTELGRAVAKRLNW